LADDEPMGLTDIFPQLRRTLQLKFVKDTIWVVASYVVLGASGIAVNTVLVGFYGEVPFGHFALAFSLYMLLHMVAVMVLPLARVRARPLALPTPALMVTRPLAAPAVVVRLALSATSLLLMVIAPASVSRSPPREKTPVPAVAWEKDAALKA